MQLSEDEKHVLMTICTSATLLDKRLHEMLTKKMSDRPDGEQINKQEDALFTAWIHQSSVAKHIRKVLEGSNADKEGEAVAEA